MLQHRRTGLGVGEQGRGEPEIMKLRIGNTKQRLEEARVGWVLLWLLGIPIPVLLILFLLRGCT
jgi:hypothetical protein